MSKKDCRRNAFMAASAFVWLVLVTTSSTLSQGLGALADAERCIQEAEKNSDLAITYCDRALKNQAGLPLDTVVGAFRARGYAFFRKGDKGGALSEFSSAISNNPNDKQSYFSRGFVRQEIGDLEGAISDYSYAIKLDPSWAPAFDKRCTAFVAKNDYRQAMKDCNEGARLKQQ